MADLPPTLAALLQVHAARAAFDATLLDAVTTEIEAAREDSAPTGLSPIAFVLVGASHADTDGGILTIPAGATVRLQSEMIPYARIRFHRLEVLSDAPIPLCVSATGLRSGGTPNFFLGDGWTPLETWRQNPPAPRFRVEINAPDALQLTVQNTGAVPVRVRIQAQVENLEDSTFGMRPSYGTNRLPRE